MGDTVTSQTLFDGSKRTVRKFTNISDGAGESDVQKIDISALTGSPTAVTIDKVWYSVSGMAVIIEFHHTSDDTALVLQGDGFMDFAIPFGGIPDPGSTGGTGDIRFTTSGHTAGDSYSIILDVKIT